MVITPPLTPHLSLPQNRLPTHPAQIQHWWEHQQLHPVCSHCYYQQERRWGEYPLNCKISLHWIKFMNIYLLTRRLRGGACLCGGARKESTQVWSQWASSAWMKHSSWPFSLWGTAQTFGTMFMCHWLSSRRTVAWPGYPTLNSASECSPHAYKAPARTSPWSSSLKPMWVSLSLISLVWCFIVVTRFTDLQYPFLEAQGVLPDILKKALISFENVSSFIWMESDLPHDCVLYFMTHCENLFIFSLWLSADVLSRRQMKCMRRYTLCWFLAYTVYRIQAWINLDAWLF